MPLRQRGDAVGFTAWTKKAGVPFAHAPDELLERMLGACVHLDPADAANGALVVVAGSHGHGRLAAAAGDVLLLRPLLLHRSAKATTPRPRRVLHFLFGPPEPAPGLQWPR